MASDDLPPGVDVLVNSPKEKTGNKLDVLKPIDDDPTNPFGSSIKRQNIYVDPKTGEQKLGALNIVNEEGDWDKWGHNLSSQFLSKQPVPLARQQLKLFEDVRTAEFERIKALENNTLKKKLLQEFADKADANAVDLQALALPRTQNKLIIPVPEMKSTEVYAPSFNHGETVALVRHPHGGIFEIPQLTVNNNQRAAKKLLGTAPIDAIGINAKVAEQLSGADFDGDTVLVIPNNGGAVKSKRPIQALVDFQPKIQYKGYEGMKVMANTQTQMGMISNLINDMSVQGAPEEHIVRAVKHSMVVIDAEKHKLDYRQSYIDNGIAALTKEYQVGGASTLLSRASKDVRVERRKPRSVADGGPIDLKTGELRFVPKDNTRFNVTKVNKRTGETTVEEIVKTEGSTMMRETSDARTLMSPRATEIEETYAGFANSMKGLANTARLEMIRTPNQVKSPSAARVYAKEVDSLKAKLDVAQRNAPLERKAQITASVKTKARLDANPDIKLKKDGEKKVRRQELADARARMGARKQNIDITPSEWEAIQAGAISHTPLMAILNNADSRQVLEYATPHSQKALSGPSASRAKSMLNMGYSQAAIAELLGVSVSTIQKLVKI